MGAKGFISLQTTSEPSLSADMDNLKNCIQTVTKTGCVNTDIEKEKKVFISMLMTFPQGRPLSSPRLYFSAWSGPSVVSNLTNLSETPPFLSREVF